MLVLKLLALFGWPEQHADGHNSRISGRLPASRRSAERSGGTTRHYHESADQRDGVCTRAWAVSSLQRDVEVGDAAMLFDAISRYVTYVTVRGEPALQRKYPGVEIREGCAASPLGAAFCVPLHYSMLGAANSQ